MPLPRYKQDLLDAELEPGETLLWAGEPDPKLAASQGKIHCVFGLFWTLGGVIFAHLSWNTEKSISGDWTLHIGAVAILIPFIGIGLYMLFMPVLIYYKFGRTVYSITSKRIITIINGKPRQVESYQRAEIGTLKRTNRDNGAGDLEIKYRPAEEDAEIKRVSGTMFFGIPDVRDVEAILRNALIVNTVSKTDDQEA